MTKSKNKILKASIAGVMVTATLPSVAFAENPSFPDLDKNTHEQDILSLAKLGILNGYPDGTFKPKKEITRGEAATVLAKALNMNDEQGLSLPFKDVEKDSFYYNAVAALVKANIINGYEDNTFRPNDILTREQMAKIIGIAYNLSSESLSIFNDVPKTSYAYNYINGLYEVGITKGVSDTQFDPNGFVTREQMASFINRGLLHKTQLVVSGKVSQTSQDSLTIGENTYKLASELLSSISPTLLPSLETADVKVIVQNNEIKAIEEIKINTVIETFDGKGLTLNSLTFNESVQILSNVNSKVIEVATTNSKIGLSNIVSENLSIVKQETKTASLHLAAVDNKFNVNLNDKNEINILDINAESISYNASSGSKVQQLQALNASNIVLNADVSKLVVKQSTSISGTAQIKQLEVLNKEAKITFSDQIKIGEYIFDNKFYTYDQLKLLGIEIQTINNSSGSNQPSYPGSGGGSGSGGQQTTPGNNTDEQPTTPGGEQAGENDSIQVTTPANATEKNGDTLLIVINDKKVEVTDEKLASLLESDNAKNISNMEVIIEDNKVVGVKAITVTTSRESSSFNAEGLTVESLTIAGFVESISGVAAANNINLTTSANSITFDATETVKGNVTIQALNAKEVKGLNSEGTVTIASSNSDLNISDIKAATLILDEPKIAMYRLGALASLNTIPLLATNTANAKITITNGEGTLIINRSQTILDIQGSSYSQVTVNSDNNTIQGNVAHLIASEKVGYLTVFGNVITMDLDGIVTPLVITGGGTITTLNVTNSSPKMIDISGVTVTTQPNDVNGSIIVPDVPPTAPTTPIFPVSIGDEVEFGYYTLKADLAANQTIKFVQLKKGETLSLDVIPTGGKVESYNNSNFLLEYSTDKIAAFLVENSGGIETLISSALIATPDRFHSQPIGFDNSKINLISPFKSTTPLTDFAKYAYVFANGKFVKAVKTLSGNATYDSTLKYTKWTLDMGTDNKADLLILMDNTIMSTITSEQTYVAAFHTMASEAIAQNDPMMMKRLLGNLSIKEGIVIDQNLLQIYAQRIKDNPDAHTSLTELTQLVEDVAEEIQYDKDIMPDLSTLLLEDNNVKFTMATSGIVTATVSNNQILLVPENAGSTLITAQDSLGNITKVAIKVDGGKVTEFIPQMLEQTDTISVVHGDATKYRTKVDAEGRTFIIPEVESTLIIRDSNSEMNLQKLSFNQNGPLTQTPITALKATLAELGLTAASSVTNANVGTIIEGNNVWFFPITTTETNIVLSDGTNSTAVNAKPTASSVGITIAKTTPLSLTTDLGLSNVEKVTNSANTNKIHSKATATELTFFANDGATTAYTVEDSYGKKTLVNIQSAKTNDEVTIATPEVIYVDITETYDVHSYSEDKVRIEGKRIYPIASGTSQVTLKDGTIYTINTSLNNHVYSINHSKETAFKIDATALGLNDIVSATENIVNGTATVANKQYIDNKELIFKMTDSGIAEIIVTSTDGSKTLFYVEATNTSGSVTYKPANIIHAKVEADDLGFNAITGTVDSVKTYARTAHTTNDLTVYGYNTGKQSAEIYNGTEKALVNIETKKNADTNLYEVHATPVTKTIGETLHADANGESIFRIKDGILYAMNTGTVELQVQSSTSGIARFAKLTVTKDPTTSHYSVSEPIYIEKHVLTIDDLGLTSITEATSNTENVKVTKDGEQITISKENTLTAPARITVTGPNGQVTYVHVTANFKAIVEKSNSIDLSTAGLENITTTEWLNGTAVRAVTEGTKVTFYSLTEGGASLKVTDSKGKTAIINITDDLTDGAKQKQATIVEKDLPESITGTLIAGDALRVSENGSKVYAVKSGTSRILLSDGKIHEYTVVELNSEYTISEPTVIETALTINLSTKLGFTNPNTVVVEDETVATAAINGDLLTIYKVSDGKTPITISDATGKKFIFNLNTADANLNNWLNIAAPVKLDTQLDVNPTLLHLEEAGIIKVQENAGKFDVLAQSFGSVVVLYNEKIHRISVVADQGEAKVNIQEISSAIITKAELGLSNSLVTPTIYNKDAFYIGKIGEELVAYAKTADSIEEVTITDGTTNKTVVRLTSNDQSYVTHKVANQPNDLAFADYGLTAITKITFKDPLLRSNASYLYLLNEGETYATVEDGTNKALAAITVSRDATDHLKAEITPIKKDANDLVETGTTITAMPNNGTNKEIVSIRENVLYATGLGTTSVMVDNYVVEITVGINPNTGKYEMSAKPMKSATVTHTQLGLNAITSYNLSANAAQVVETVQNGKTLIFYGKATGSAQITVTEKDDDKTWNSLINVTVASNGDITALPVKFNTAIQAPVSATETVQNAQARAIWKDNSVEVFAVGEGKSAVAFAKGTLNVEVKKDSTTGSYSFVGTPSFAKTAISAKGLNVVTGNEFAHIEEVGDETIIVAKDAGKVILLSADTMYEVTISKDAYGHVLISQPKALPFKALEIEGGYTVTGSSVATMEANVDTDDASELIVYPTGTNGTSDIHFTSNAGQSTYQVTVNDNQFESSSPKLAEVDLTTELTGLTTSSSNVSIKGNKLQLHAEGNSYLESANGFVNVVVTRDAHGYFTATQTMVKETLSEAMEYVETPSTNYTLNDTKTIIVPTAISNTQEVLYTSTKRIEVSTKVENDHVMFKKVEQDMKFIPYGEYGMTNPVIESNSVPTVASSEVRGDGQLVVYALTPGSTTITYKDGDNKIAIYVNVDENKNLTATIAGDSAAITLADLGIGNTVTLSEYDTTKAQATVSNGLIRFTAKGTGRTSFTISENNVVKALVNVDVYTDANNQLAARTTVLESKYAVTENKQLSGSTLFRVHNGKYYAINIGNAVYKTADGEATIVRIEKSTTDEATYSLIETKRHLLEVKTTDELELAAIQSAIIADNTVAESIVKDNVAYLYAKNDGTSDVLVADNSNSNANKAIVQVTNTGGTLSRKIAQETLPAELNGLNAEWVDQGNSPLLQVRNSKIYALATGFTTIKNADGVVANVTVQRDTVLPFKTNINLPKVQPIVGKSVTVISGGSAIHVIGDTIYAKTVGEAKVEVDGKIRTIKVSQTANGKYSIEALAEKAQIELNKLELGLDSIVSATVTSAIVSNEIQEVDSAVEGNELVIIAEQAGTGVLKVKGTSNGAEVETTVQITVASTNNVLSIQDPIIAKTNNPGVTFYEVSTSTDTSMIRIHDGEVFALKTGETFVKDTPGTLYKVKAEQTDALRVTASEISHTFTGATSITKDPTQNAVEISGEKVLVKALNTSVDLVVDNMNYRLTVDGRGNITVHSLAQNSFDLSEIFDGANEITANSDDADFVTIDHTENSPIITITPLQDVELSKVVRVTSGGKTAQLLINITKVGTEYKATAELISKSFTAADIGFHMDDEVIEISNGIAKVVNGVLKVYPGEFNTHDFKVKHTSNGETLRETIMRLDVAGLNQFTADKLSTTVTDSNFVAETKVIAQQGTALATGGTTIKVTNFDGTPTLFVVNTSSGYRQFTVSTNWNSASNTYNVSYTTVESPYVVTGTVANVNGSFYVAEHAGDSIIYSNSAGTGSAMINGYIHNLTAENDENNIVRAEQVTEPESGTGFTFVSGIENVELIDGKWIAKAKGVGYFKNATGYKKVSVIQNATDPNLYEIQVDEIAHQTLDAKYDNITLLKHPDLVFVDGNTIYGEVDSSNIVVAAFNGENRELLVGTTLGSGTSTDLSTFKIDILDKLGWTNVASQVINKGVNMARIVNSTGSSELFIQNFGEFKATFTAASGVTKTLEFEIDSNYNLLPITVGINTISYDVLPNAGAINGNIKFSITFDLNVSTDVMITQTGVSQLVFDNNVIVTPVSQATSYAQKLKITTPEISPVIDGAAPVPVEATINGEKTTDWEVTVTDSANKVNFNKKN